LAQAFIQFSADLGSNLLPVKH